MRKQNGFKLIMISAMYENGGNTTHRFLDGHPQLFVYPFESQVGTPLVSDWLTTLFPVKYRWPVFSLDGSLSDDYELIIDEELKRHVKTPFASKFKSADMKLDDKDRKKTFLRLLKNKPRTRANIVQAFFQATFLAWKDYNTSGKEIAYVGYSPIIEVDAEKIFTDFPNGHIIHVVRNPYSAFADTKKRPVPYGISRYVQTWSIVQLLALQFADLYPKNFHIVRFEDLVADPKKFFKSLTKKLDISYEKTLEYPSWNRRKLDDMVPWGTIRIPTPESNMKTMRELSKAEYREIKMRTKTMNKIIGYEHL